MYEILNEKTYVHKILNENYVDPYINNPLRILAKHYVIEGYTKKQVYDEVINYACKHYQKDKGGEKNNRKYEKEELELKVEKFAKKAINKRKQLEKREKTYKLFEIDKIHITKNELYKISMLNNFTMERLAYVMLVLSKIYKAKYGNIDSDYRVECNRNVFDEAFVPYTTKNKHLINEMKQTGHLQPDEDRSDSRYVKVMFADKDDDSEIAITILDFRNFAYTYDQYRGSKMIKNCTECNVLFEKKSSTHKYCDKCKRDKELQHHRERMKKCRENKNVMVRESAKNP